MEFEQFAVSRDFFYLAWCCAGAALGCLFSRFRKKTTLRFRNRTVTIALCFFSCMAAALAAAFVYSKGAVYLEKTLYIPAGILGAILILAFRFPRAAGFPLILLTGLAVVWLGFSFLRFPRLDPLAGESGPPVALVRRDREERFLVRIISGPQGASNTLTLEVPGDGAFEFTLDKLACASLYPLIGGEIRGTISGIREDSQVLYTAPALGFHLPWGVSREEIRGGFPINAVQPGTGIYLYFDGKSLIYR
jgi:protein-S-isoprenylcysteine O-methyltransferase Ste14